MKTAIIYSTKYGSPAVMAGVMQKELPGDTDLFNLKKDALPGLGDYDAVILGGSIYMGSIQKVMKVFIQKHKEELQNKVLGLYICAGEDKEPQKTSQLENAFPAPLREKAVAVEICGDAVDITKVNLMEKIALRLIKGIKTSYDRLDHEAARRVGKAVAEALQ